MCPWLVGKHDLELVILLTLSAELEITGMHHPVYALPGPEPKALCTLEDILPTEL